MRLRACRLPWYMALKKEAKPHPFTPSPLSPSYFLRRGASKIKSAVTGSSGLTELWRTLLELVSKPHCLSLPRICLLCWVKVGQLICFFFSPPPLEVYSVGFSIVVRHPESKKVRDVCVDYHHFKAQRRQHGSS